MSKVIFNSLVMVGKYNLLLVLLLTRGKWNFLLFPGYQFPGYFSFLCLLQNLSQTPVLRELLKEAKMPDTTVKIESPELSMVYMFQPSLCLFIFLRSD